MGIGAKPAVGPFERVGLNKDVGGIQVSLTNDNWQQKFIARLIFQK